MSLLALLGCMSRLALADGSGTGAPAPGPTSRPSNNTIVPFTIGGQGQTPAYTVVRWNENYTFLRDAAKRDAFFDAIKHIPLTQDGKTYLSLGGEVRERYELFNNLNFGPPTAAQDHDGYWLTRLLAYGDLHVGDNIRFFGEIKTALIDQREGGPRATDADEFDFDQGFGDFKLPFNPNDSLTLRVGRQYLLYGARGRYARRSGGRGRQVHRERNRSAADLAGRPAPERLQRIQPFFRRHVPARHGAEQ